MNSLTDTQIDELVDYLRGSCQSITAALYSLFDIDDEDIITLRQNGIIDDNIFNCATCGWWCDAGEYSENITDELICFDCGEE